LLAGIDNALMHFDLAVRIFQTGEIDSSDILESYKSSSGLMHGMDAGYARGACGIRSLVQQE
jgi:hypothetical protein